MLDKSLKAYLILENGRVFSGRAFGHLKEAVGEIVFCTSMAGYQEIITDPSYAGRILMMTYPLVGNTGINLDDMESDGSKLKALIVREKCNRPNNWRCEMEIDGFLKQNKIIGIEGIDTRAVMGILREEGAMKAIVTTRIPGSELTKSQITQKFEANNNKNIVKEITCPEKYVIDAFPAKKHIGVIDLGIKDSLINELKRRNYKITVYPAFTTAEEILKDDVDSVLVSNGAGSPLDIGQTVETVKALTGRLPVFGVSLGHHVVSLALGCTVSKMKSGHHGGNYPVKDLKTERVYITSQNNDYTISDLPEDVEIRFKNINDGIIEGIEHKRLPVMSVQFMPETTECNCHTGFVFELFEAMAEMMV